MVTERAQPRRIDLPDMSADMVESRRFSQSWRGYDQDEVKQFLAEVARQVRAWKERYEAAEAARRDAEQRAAHPQLDEATLMSALGDQTAAILRSAHIAADDIVSKAEANAEQLVNEAQSKADEIAQRAESLLAERTSEAETLAAKILEDARSEAEKLRSEGRRLHEEMVESAREQSEKILAELARKRRLATVQIEQLRAGREKLLEAYKAVRRTLDEVTAELQRADAQARAASQAVARQYSAEVGTDQANPTTSAPAGPAGPADDAWLELVEEATGAPATEEARAEEARAEEARAEEARAGLQGPGSTPGDASAQPTSAPVVRAPKVAQVAGERAGLPSVQNAPVVARAAEFESVRIVREPVAHGTAEKAETGPPAALPTSRPVSDKEVGDPPTAEVSPGAPSEEVENLFARIRAARAEATNKARKAVRQPAGEQPAGEQPAGEQPAGEQPAGEQPAGEQPAGGQPAGEDDVPTPPMGTPVTSTERGLFSERDEVFGRLESSLARKLKRALQDEQNDLLDKLRGAKGPVTAARILPSVEEHPDRFVEVGRPLLEEAARAGLSASTKMFGLPATTKLNPSNIEDLADELGRAVAEPLRQRLEEALRSDGEPPEVADAIGAAYREWKTQRIEAAARDQLAAAWARGAYLALPEGTRAVWVVDPNEGPCPDCEDNALARAQPKGQPWPTGQLHPPAHPGCRCALAPEDPPEALASASRPSRGRPGKQSAKTGQL